mgnify:CR=1 FL=1
MGRRRDRGAALGWRLPVTVSTVCDSAASSTPIEDEPGGHPGEIGWVARHPSNEPIRQSSLAWFSHTPTDLDAKLSMRKRRDPQTVTNASARPLAAFTAHVAITP